MALFNKKKKFNPNDELGRKVPPYYSEVDTLDSMGSYAVLERSNKSIAVGKVLTKIIVGCIALYLAAASITPVFFSNRIKKVENNVVALETPAFKSRYAELGKSIIKAYYNLEKPPVNLLQTATWSVPIASGEDAEDQDTSQQPVLNAKIDVENLALIDMPAAPPIHPSKSKKSIFTNPYSEVLVYSGYVDGVLYKFSVNLVIPNRDDMTTLPYLVAAPSMLPMESVVQNGEENIDTPIANSGTPYTPLSLNDTSKEVIRDWASAYAQGEKDDLKRITGDRDPAHLYNGLGGFRLEGNPVIVWSFIHDAGTSDDDSDDAIIARVIFNMEKKVKSESSEVEASVLGESNSTFNQIQTFDILLQNFQSGSPNITSWGPAGSWGILSPYSNAVTLTKEQFDKLNSGESIEESEIVTENDFSKSTNSSDVVPSLTSQEREGDEKPSTSKRKSNGNGFSSTKKREVTHTKSSTKTSSKDSDKDSDKGSRSKETKANEITVVPEDNK